MKTIFSFIVLMFLFQSANAQYKHDSIKIEHGYLHYYTKGEGKPVVLLQGGPGFSSFYMRGIADLLDGYKTILVDYQGTGRSHRKIDSTWVGIDKVIQDVETVRKKLNISDWTVIGHSYGGLFGMYYAIKFPNVVNKVIPVAGTHTDNKFQKYYFDNISMGFTKEDKAQMNKIMKDSNRTMDEKTVEIIMLQTKAGYFFNRKFGEIFFNSFPPHEMQMLYNLKFGEAFAQRPAFMNIDIGKAVYALDKPIRIISGRQDPGGEGSSVLLNERSKNSKIVFIEKSGHFPWVEQPADFFKTLNAFLEN